MKLPLLTTSRWTKIWFLKLVLHFLILITREFYNISYNTFTQNFNNLKRLLNDPNIICLALFEDTMNLYSYPFGIYRWTHRR